MVVIGKQQFLGQFALRLVIRVRTGGKHRVSRHLLAQVLVIVAEGQFCLNHQAVQ